MWLNACGAMGHGYSESSRNVFWVLPSAGVRLRRVISKLNPLLCCRLGHYKYLYSVGSPSFALPNDIASLLSRMMMMMMMMMPLIICCSWCMSNLKQQSVQSDLIFQRRFNIFPDDGTRDSRWTSDYVAVTRRVCVSQQWYRRSLHSVRLTRY